MTRDSADVEEQEAFHFGLFEGMTDWDRTYEQIVDLSGDSTDRGLLGLDQLGHFGVNGIDLALEHLDLAVLPPAPLFLDLGSGFGGVSRLVSQRIAETHPDAAFVGVELVFSHCQLSKQIDLTLASRASRSVICASADQLPLASQSCDVAICVGSIPHFRAPGEVISEARRVLRSNGVFVATEEVSLLRRPAGDLAAFRRSHPADVFYTSTIEDRFAQMQRVGFADITIIDVTPWAIDVLTQRLKALKLFRGSVERILGSIQTERVELTLRDALSAYVDHAIVPAVIRAVVP